MESAPKTLADLYQEQADVLVKISDKISDHQDESWIQDRIQKLMDKRDVQEARVAILKAAVESGSNEPVEDLLKRLADVKKKAAEVKALGGVQLDLFDHPGARAVTATEERLPTPDAIPDMTTLRHCLHEESAVDATGIRICAVCGAMLGIA